MEGMSKKSAKELVPLAKSWLQPAKLEAKSGCSSQGYDRAQRAYMLTAKGSTISVRIKASEKSPVVNPAFVVKNWGDANAALQLNGKKVKRGKDFRVGHRGKLDGTDLIVWFEAESTKPVEVSLSAVD